MIPPDVVRQIRRLHLTARRAVAAHLGGAYQSAFKGTGLNFAEVREYVPGDDVRSIDWNVTARAGQAFVKKYTEERELTVLLAVDLSGSLRFGTAAHTKRAVAAEVAALLAFAAAANNDRVGLVAFTDTVERHVPPGKGTRHVLRVLRDILYFRPESRRTDPAAAFDLLAHVYRRRAVVFVISDFLTPVPERALRRAGRRHDTVLIRVSDPRERTWPAAGLVRIEDAETGEQRLVDTADARFRTAFAARAAERDLAFAAAARKAGADRIETDTAGGHFAAVLNFLRARDRRRGRP